MSLPTDTEEAEGEVENRGITREDSIEVECPCFFSGTRALLIWMNILNIFPREDVSVSCDS